MTFREYFILYMGHLSFMRANLNSPVHGMFLEDKSQAEKAADTGSI